MEPDLEGVRAHVTGAARGIGLAIATRLAEGGAKLALSDMDEAGAKAAAEGLPGEGHVGFGADVRSTEQVEAALAQSAEALGGLNTVVANAGIEISSLLHEMGDEDFARLYDINVHGVHRTMRGAVPHLIGNGGGTIITLASAAGLGGVPLLGAYAGTKAAVLRLTETMATELKGQGIRAVGVCPAFIDTEMVERLVPSVEALTGMAFSDLAAIKQGRLGTVEEVAEMVAYLASEDAAHITGSRWVLDGGLVGGLL
jgi:NAD(P)-dependent dehydrogenase (short-subunit alcohol dehydrogenase family)